MPARSCKTAYNYDHICPFLLDVSSPTRWERTPRLTPSHPSPFGDPKHLKDSCTPCDLVRGWWAGTSTLPGLTGNACYVNRHIPQALLGSVSCPKNSMFDWCTDLVFFIFFCVVILTHLLGTLRLKTLIVRGFRIQRHVDSICYVLFIYCFIYLYIYTCFLLASFGMFWWK